MKLAEIAPIAAGVQVVHCTVQRRPDRLGADHNANIISTGRGEVNILPGTPSTDVLLQAWSRPDGEKE